MKGHLPQLLHLIKIKRLKLAVEAIEDVGSLVLSTVYYNSFVNNLTMMATV